LLFRQGLKAAAISEFERIARKARMARRGRERRASASRLVDNPPVLGTIEKPVLETGFLMVSSAPTAWCAAGIERRSDVFANTCPSYACKKSYQHRQSSQSQSQSRSESSIVQFPCNISHKCKVFSFLEPVHLRLLTLPEL